MSRLSGELDNTASLLDLALSVLGEVAGADDERDGGDTALAEDLAVTERKQVEDGSSLGLVALGEVLLALLGRDEGPELDFLVSILIIIPLP